MCDPTGGVLTTALLVGSTAASAGSAVMAGYQANAQARYQAQVADQNATLAKQQAAQVQQQGSQDALDQARKTAALEGEQTVAFASQGLNVGFGTPLDLITGTAKLGSEDLTRLRQNTQDRVTALTMQASDYTTQAGVDRAAGENAITSGWLKAGGDILGGAAQITKGGFGRTARA